MGGNLFVDLRAKYKAPLLISLPVIWSYLNFVYTNRFENFSMYWFGIYFCLSLLIVFIGYFFFLFILSWYIGERRVNVIYAVSVMCFFSYFMIYEIADVLWQRHYLKTWGAYTVLMLTVMWILSRYWALQDKLIIIGLALALVPAVQLLIYQVQTIFDDTSIGDTSVSTSALGSPDSLPDIFHIILDQYGDNKTLYDIYGFDNSDYLRELRERDFYIAENARSNYQRTQLSIPSTMAMEYIFQGEINAGVMAESGLLLHGKGGVFEAFKNAGYYVALLRYDGADCGPSYPDLCFSRGRINYGDLEKNLLNLTPIGRLVDVGITSLGTLSTSYFEIEDVNKAMSSIETDRPVFAHIHMLIPHSPYRFTRTCEPIDSVPSNLDQNESKYYIEQLECANMQSLELIDSILKHFENPIIILQSDHGVKFGVDIGDWRTDKNWVQSYGILSAWKIPQHMDCRNLLSPTLTTVNTFRVVLNCISDNPLSLLPNRWFTEEGGNEYIEILRN